MLPEVVELPSTSMTKSRRVEKNEGLVWDAGEAAVQVRLQAYANTVHRDKKPLTDIAANGQERARLFWPDWRPQMPCAGWPYSQVGHVCGQTEKGERPRTTESRSTDLPQVCPYLRVTDLARPRGRANNWPERAAPIAGTFKDENLFIALAR